MLRIASLAACAALIAVPSAAFEIIHCENDSDVPLAVADQLDAVLLATVDPEAPLASRFGYAPGGVLSIHAPEWRYERVAGVSDPDTQEALTCETPFQIGSNTKMMTSSVLLQLMEEQKLALDDPLSKYLPGLAEGLPHGGDITLRQLANHTSGVFSYTDNAPDGTPGVMEGDLSSHEALRRGYTMGELARFAIDHGEPTFAPGDDGRWAYSNTGYVLLGLIIEKLDGRPIAESFRDRIYQPLGMENTFYATGVPNAGMGLPRAYFEAPFDVETTDWNLSQGAAAGAVVSTIEDMHVFIRALLAGDLFESQDTLEIMKQTVPTGNSTIPAYGIGLSEKSDDVWGHGGQTLGFESDIAYFVDADLSMVGWAASANNIMVVGVSAVSSALVASDVLPDPSIAIAAKLRGDLTAVEWNLVSIEVYGDKTLTPEDGTTYTILLSASGDFSAQADCNRVLGDWNLNSLELSFRLGPTTLTACPPASISDEFIQWLAGAGSVYIDEVGNLNIFVNQGDAAAQLTFEPAS